MTLGGTGREGDGGDARVLVVGYLYRSSLIYDDADGAARGGVFLYRSSLIYDDADGAAPAEKRALLRKC